MSPLLRAELCASYVFAEFPTADEANIAIATIHGTHFDKSHSLFANRFTDIEKFASMDETYVEPEVEPYVPKVRVLLSHKILIDNRICGKEHLRSWLADPQSRDQFVIYKDDVVSINWHHKPNAPEVAAERQVSIALSLVTRRKALWARISELDGSLRSMVSLWDVLCFHPSTGCAAMGRCIVDTPRSICSPWGETHLLLPQRELRRDLVTRTHCRDREPSAQHEYAIHRRRRREPDRCVGY